MEQWLDADDDESKLRASMELLVRVIEEQRFDFCSLGGCTSPAALAITPFLLASSKKLSSSFRIDSDGSAVPPYDKCLQAANTVLALSQRDSSGSANFNFCVAFNCPPQTPFFPVAYHENGEPSTLTVGLESGDLLFLAFHGMGEDFERARRNLEDVLLQSIQPLEEVMEAACDSVGLHYGGIDASMNPGLDPLESVAAGIENLYPHRFGSTGTLASVATITSAIKSLQPTVKLAGYCGLMLPVMEDVTLAARAGYPIMFNLSDPTSFTDFR